MSKLTSLILVLFITAGSLTHADVLLLEGIEKEPVNSQDGVLRPTQGMSAQKVKETWGIPKSVTEPVGNPPIQRWEYEKFYVFFEKEHVINSVFKKPNELSANDK